MTRHAFDAPSSLMLRTRQLLLSSEKSYLQIHKETRLPFDWLKKFAYGEIKNPSVNRVQTLYEYLNGAPLALAL